MNIFDSLKSEATRRSVLNLAQRSGRPIDAKFWYSCFPGKWPDDAGGFPSAPPGYILDVPMNVFMALPS